MAAQWWSFNFDFNAPTFSPSNNQVMILQDTFSIPSLAETLPVWTGGKCLHWSVLISTLLVLMVKTVKEIGLNINEELREDDDVAIAFFTVLCVQDNESPGEQRPGPACWLLLHFTRNPPPLILIFSKGAQIKITRAKFSVLKPQSERIWADKLSSLRSAHVEGQ